MVEGRFKVVRYDKSHEVVKETEGFFKGSKNGD